MPGAPIIFSSEIYQKKKDYKFLSFFFWLIKKKRFLVIASLVIILFFSMGHFVKKPAKCILLPNPLPEFVGRKEILQEIKKGLTHKKRGTIPVVSLWGEGGIGKTETAIHFANENLSRYSLICWINVGSKEAYEHSYQFLAEHLGFKVDNKLPFDQLREKVHFILENKKFSKPWLLIFDNAECSFPLPQRGWGRVIITARNKMVGHADSLIEVPLFSLEEVTQLYQQVVHPEVDEHWLTIAHYLNFFPLAVNQALHYMKDSPHFTPQEYCKSLGEEQLFTVPSARARYPHTLVAVWEKSKNGITQANPKAYEWLQLCASLYPDQIALQWLDTWLQKRWGLSTEEAHLEANQILTLLANRGHIHINPVAKSFSIHRLKQHLIKLNEEEDSISSQMALSFLVDQVKELEIFDRIDEPTLDKQHLAQWETHAAWWLNHHYGKIENREEEIRLLNVMGNLQVTMHGKYSNGLKYYESALEIAPPDGLAKANTLLNKGLCLRILLEFEKAKKDFIEALELFERLPKEMVGNLKISLLTKLGGLAHWGGDSAQAIEWMEKAVEVHNELYDDTYDFYYSEILKWCGIIWEWLGDVQKAIDYLINALEINHQVFGQSEDIQRARIMRELGYCIMVIDEHELALKYSKKGYQIEKKIRPYNNADEWLYLMQISANYCRRRNAKLAVYYSNKAKASMDKCSGFKHRHVDFYYLVMGKIYLRLNQPKDAISQFRKGLEEYRKISQGRNDAWVIKFLKGIGESCLRMGANEEAINYFEQALQIVQSLFPDDHWLLGKIVEGLGMGWMKKSPEKSTYYLEWAKRAKKNKPKLTDEQKQTLIKLL